MADRMACPVKSFGFVEDKYFYPFSPPPLGFLEKFPNFLMVSINHNGTLSRSQGNAPGDGHHLGMFNRFPSFWYVARRRILSYLMHGTD
jgi:hypothetical protein